MSAFALEDGVVFHTYSAYTRASTRCGNMWQWLDARRSPQRSGPVLVPRHDQYEASYR